MNNEILGPFEKEKLFELPGFEASSLICPQTPVGEKTEDWEEASSYSEVALMFNSPSASSAPDIPAPVQEQKNPPMPAADSTLKMDSGAAGTATPDDIKFKPLSASSLEPTAPPPSLLENKNTGIEINSFGALKSDGKIEHPVTELARSAAASFDAISLSQIRKKTTSISAADGATDQNPAKTDSAATPAVGNQDPESANLSAAGRPPSQPEVNEKSASPAAVDTAAFEALSSKIRTLCETALTRQELNSQLEPLKQKLERMGETLASTDSGQLQRDLLMKVSYIEKAVSEIKSSLSAAAGGKTTQVLQMKDKAKPEAPKKDSNPAEIVDSGRNNIRIGLFFKKASKFIITLLLIIAVALVAVIGLKQFQIFDATRFIPFPIPFLTENKAAPASETQAANEQPQSPEASAKPSAPEQQAAPVKVEPIPPEVIYFIHTYALRPGAITLENIIRQESAKAGWDSDKLNWENCAQSGNTPEAGKFKAAPGAYALTAVVPSKDGKNRLSFPYEVDTKLGTVKPLDEIGKTAMETLISASVIKTQPKSGALKNGRQARRAGAHAKAPPATQARQPAPRKQAQTPPLDEYDYVDEADTGQ